ncbi:MAG: DUF438 domain-containing protein [Actinomycetota bacterium]
MSEYLEDKDKKKKIVKEVIRQLHEGLSAQEAKERLQKEVGNISSSDIADIEQSLIDEGMSPDEIKKFCNVHALLFESSLQEMVSREESPSHPVNLFKQENREIEKILEKIKGLVSGKGKKDVGKLKTELEKTLKVLAKVDLHYVRKEQLLFPYLERYGFMGPSKVMWGKDNEIRGLLKGSMAELGKVSGEGQWEEYVKKYINPLVEEVEGMIFKEENILLPTSQEKLSNDDWIGILKESSELGYVFIEKPKQISKVIEELKGAVPAEPEIKAEGLISFPTGELKLGELMYILNMLPVDLTFVDSNDKVKYFSDNKNRVFVRTRSVIGREVRNCHPPQSVDAVEKILEDFKEKRRDDADFWINFKGRFVYIKFFAIRDEAKNYLGTLEVAMDATHIRSLKGEKRLLDEGN